jgi:hypothetical protein
MLKQASTILSKCGKRVIPPAGLEFVDVEKKLLYQVSTGANAQITGYRDIPGDAPFICKAISAIQDVTTWYRVQWPDGRFLQNNMANLAPDAWAGSFRRSLTREVICPPESRITIQTNTLIPAAGASNVALLFEGAVRYARDKATGQMLALTSQQARYFANPNLNILAPEMDLDLSFPEIPKGYSQQEFRQCSPALVLNTPGGEGTVSIPSSEAFDYLIRRILFEVSFSDGVTGQVLVQVRDGNGFSLLTDFAPYNLVNNMLLAHLWCVGRGTAMFFDFLFIPTGGSGTVTVQANTVGVGQYRRAA